mmetsp:Transcript_30744/g.49312  ORF Transcript_30744/g.49312 Transcript_30744/m.49312 type:complete len:143 (-) Transcript_30744:565-993(-)|eukprot:CAMPEP_0197029884 /NCGR_PEP_ID=MMETSP1384-20130603/9237_1 /TAXON_ID=29189 /ORGANISM="Ammonia sp." /LENGTH=142 /DNA_ID=CAMNT_0042459127 /DNA_START=105 /DNA_END=533 /DNA_ORIENTATION=-
MLRLISTVVRKQEDPASKTPAGAHEIGEQQPNDSDIAKKSDAWMQRMIYPCYLDYAIYDEPTSAEDEDGAEPQDLSPAGSERASWQTFTPSNWPGMHSENSSVMKAAAANRQRVGKLPRLSSLRSAFSMIYRPSSTSDRIES